MSIAPNYSYQWNTNPIQTMLTTGLFIGTYSCTITDNNLCDTTTVVFIITEPTDFNIVKSNNLLCYGDTNGTKLVC